MGVVKQAKEAIVFFEPQKKATGYIMEYKIIGTESWQQKMINAAQIDCFHINGLDPKKTYEFRMLTLNENGKSIYSETIKSL
jgi:beta-galactosidase